jgi:tubulin-specific chaperone A
MYQYYNKTVYLSSGNSRCVNRVVGVSIDYTALVKMPKKVPLGPAQRLAVQIKVVARMQKECSEYEKEVVMNEARIQKMRDDGKDPYDIKKQEEVLAESHMMIPDSKNRLEAAVETLDGLVKELTGDEEVDQAVVEEASALVASLTA